MKFEYVNIMVSDVKVFVVILMDIFDWYICWEGVLMDEGYIVYVGDCESYLVLYSLVKVFG